VKRIAIERRSRLTREEFARDFLANGGRPVIVTDALAGWPALSRWTFDYLKSRYGSDLVQVTLDMHSTLRCTTKLDSYFSHFDSPGELPGLWVDTASGRPVTRPTISANAQPYLMGWGAFERHPELHNDLAPIAFIDDWTTALSESARLALEELHDPELWSLYVGPANTLSPLHLDFGGTHSWLAQVQGTKRGWLFAPADRPLLYEGAVDPEHPDLNQYPLFDQSTIWEGDFGPGELLFTPSMWWHQVRSLTKSVTVSHNFFNASNFSAWLEHVVNVATRAAKPVNVSAT
jgi:hypothetical protein